MTTQRRSVVELNGSRYVVVGDIIMGYVPRQSNPFRLQGVQATKDDPSVNRFRSSSFPKGIGFAKMNRETGRGVGGLLDSTCETGFGPVTLGKLHETQTHAAVADHCKKMVNFKSDFWGLFEEDFSGGADLLVCRKWGATSDNWTGGGTIHTAATTAHSPRGFDMIAHGKLLYEVHSESDGTPDHIYKVDTSPDGATWSDASGTLFPDDVNANSYLTSAICARNAFDDDMAKLLSFGNFVILAIYLHPDSADGDGTIAVFSTVDAGANWSAEGTVPSGSGPKALLDWYNLAGERSPILITAEGIYSIDLTNDTIGLMQALDGDPLNGRCSKVSNLGDLYVGLGTGQLQVFSLTGTGRLSSFISGPPGDGLVEARQGHVTCMFPVREWMLVAYGGHAASTFASIFKIDSQVIFTDPETNKAYNPWHHVWEDATGNLDIVTMAYSPEDDATPRLHWAMEGTAATINYHIEEPFVHPNQSTTVKYQATGILRIPDDDLGDPHSQANVVQVMVDADDLTAGVAGSGGSSDEFITVRYGINGASDTTTTFGDFLSGTLVLLFGASEEGIAARRVGINLLFDRGSTATKTPKLNEFEIQAYHNYVDKLYWEFDIDIDATAQGVTKPALVADTDIHETIITAIKTVATSATGVTLTVGDMTQTPVQCPANQPPLFALRVVDSDKNRRGYSTGFCHIKLVDAVVPGRAIRFEYYRTGDITGGAVWGANWQAQTFTVQAGRDHAIEVIELKGGRYGNGGALPGIVTVSIKAVDASGHPVGADLAVGTFDADIMPNVTVYDTDTAEWVSVTVEPRTPLKAGTQYAIVVRALDGDFGNRFRWGQDNSSPTYTGGALEASSDSGATWVAISGSDMMFGEVGKAG